MDSSLILSAVDAVTKPWTKQRKAEERRQSRATSRRWALADSRGPTIRHVARVVMAEAYLKASGGGRYPAAARQIYYAARPAILEIVSQSTLDSHYFTQRLLPEYLAAHPDETGDWDVVYDARGHIAEPHTEVVTPLGTLDVRGYLRDIAEHAVGPVAGIRLSSAFPTCGPQHRFGAILFVEKEGFLPLFDQVKLAERYDLAIMSTKGMPVVASRRLVDELCGGYDIPLLVLHDFDKAGFSILGTLSGAAHWDANTLADREERYEYRHDFHVIDLGLRLEDVKEHDLQAEPVRYKSDPSDNLTQNGASAEEIEFLRGDNDWTGYHGQRVELNAFTSDVFVKWIERKLKHHGIEKIVPDDDTLKAAYRRAYQIAVVNSRIRGGQFAD